MSEPKSRRQMKTKEGICNLCLNYFPSLTDDHVPPKGSIKPRKVGLKKLSNFVNPVDPRIKDKISQNGVKFPTLCNQCNNRRLGKELDPALNDFSRRIAHIMRNAERLTFPSKVPISCKPQQIVRSIFGHLLASELREDMTSAPAAGPKRDLMRRYVMDPILDLPQEFNVFFWPFCADYQVMLSGTAMLKNNQIIKGDFLKYFPLAFWITYEAPISILSNMRDYELLVRASSFNEEREIFVKTGFQGSIRPDWPEFPGDDEILGINDRNSVAATPA